MSDNPTRSGLGLLIAVVVARLLLHLFTAGEYGFHRDELATLDDARHLAAGYVAYPPLTPFFGRVSLELFGPSLVGIRLFPALAQALAMLMAGLMARELGASPAAQAVAAVAAGVSPFAMMSGVLLQYVVFDYLFWVLTTWCMFRLIRTGDARWWLGVGLFIGLGMMTRYTMGVLVIGIVAATLLTPLRRHLRSPWLWAGAALSVLIFLPNLLWQVRNDFITLDFLRAIHERDVRIGRTGGFVSGQFFISTNPLTVPLWLAGLWFFFSRHGKEFRAIGWMFVAAFTILLFTGGRAYYLGPAFPMLFAGGALVWDAWISRTGGAARRAVRFGTAVVLLIAAATAAALGLPIGAVNSPLWNARMGVHQEFAEQIGWEELVATVASVWETIPPEERRTTGIFAGNYGEAGAVNLFGKRYGLPGAIGGVNSYWARGWGEPDPETLILLGSDLEEVEPLFEQCAVAARVTNRYGVENEESRDHPEILLCRGPKFVWKELWPDVRGFG